MALADDEVNELLEDLASNVDELEAALMPLLDGSFAKRAEESTPIERARLYTWAVYTINSLLYSYINLSGSDGKSHMVFTELKRVQQYFQKIDAVENPSSGKVLDKPAVKRFVERGLEGNDKWDKQREEMKAREREGAKRKFEELDAKMKDGEDGESKAKKKKKEKKNKDRGERRTKLESAMDAQQDEVPGVDGGAQVATPASSFQAPQETDEPSSQRKKKKKNKDRMKKEKAET